MPLDPAAELLLQQIATTGIPAFDAGSVEQARENALALATVQGDAEPVGCVENRKIPGPDGDLPVRIYASDHRPPLAAFVYLHGGGWVICNLDTHDATCRAIANAVPAVVVSVDYRLAPEHRFPAAAEDAYAATHWLADNAAAFGADPKRLIVGGDSAGGNLAAVAALMARDRGGPALAYQVLIYPAIDASMTMASYDENAEGYLLTRSAMAWFWNHYLGPQGDGRHPYASPIAADDLSGLPPATIITAEFDPLRDEGDAYAARLRAAGVSVRHTRYAGLIHGFVSLGAVFSQARTAIDAMAADVRTALGG
jgi:acetyl esterase